MKVKKISCKNKLNTFTELEGYDHYLALDWSQDIFSLARVTQRSKTPKLFSGPAKIELLNRTTKKN